MKRLLTAISYRRRAISAFLILLGLCTGTSAAPLKIMPLGDSRTAGPSSPTCYRLYLDHLMKSAGYDFDFVGSLTGHEYDGRLPDSGFDSDHEGHWGWPVQNLTFYGSGASAQGVGKWTRATNPDIVLALLGITDLLYDSDSFTSRSNRTVREIGTLIDSLRGVNPAVIVLLANQYPTSPNYMSSGTSALIDTFNIRIPGLVADKNTIESPVIFIDVWTGFDAGADIWDGLHANQRGCAKMAQNWLGGLWPFFDSIPPVSVGPVLPRKELCVHQSRVTLRVGPAFSPPSGLLFTPTGRRIAAPHNTGPASSFLFPHVAVPLARE